MRLPVTQAERNVQLHQVPSGARQRFTDGSSRPCVIRGGSPRHFYQSFAPASRFVTLNLGKEPVEHFKL